MIPLKDQGTKTVELIQIVHDSCAFFDSLSVRRNTGVAVPEVTGIASAFGVNCLCLLAINAGRNHQASLRCVFGILTVTVDAGRARFCNRWRRRSMASFMVTLVGTKNFNAVSTSRLVGSRTASLKA